MAYVEVKYLFDSELTDSLEKLISESKKVLQLISPYIDLSPKIKERLQDQLDKKDPDFKLQVMFGKDGIDKLKKYKNPKLRTSIEFLMRFPNVEIKFEERLHAKFYKNDHDILFSSMNLYDYSEKNNIEFGIKQKYSSKGLLGKVIDVAGDAYSKGVDKIDETVLGKDKELDPIEKFDNYFNHAELLYKTEPKTKKKEGLFNSLKDSAGLGSEIVDGMNVLEDKLSKILDNQSSNSESKPIGFQIKETAKPVSPPVQKSSGKLVSASALGKPSGLKAKEVKDKMEVQGFIKGETVTSKGKAQGIIIKNGQYGEFLAFPESFTEYL